MRIDLHWPVAKSTARGLIAWSYKREMLREFKNAPLVEKFTREKHDWEAVKRRSSLSVLFLLHEWLRLKRRKDEKELEIAVLRLILYCLSRQINLFLNILTTTLERNTLSPRSTFKFSTCLRLTGILRNWKIDFSHFPTVSFLFARKISDEDGFKSFSWLKSFSLGQKRHIGCECSSLCRVKYQYSVEIAAETYGDGWKAKKKKSWSCPDLLWREKSRGLKNTKERLFGDFLIDFCALFVHWTSDLDHHASVSLIPTWVESIPSTQQIQSTNAREIEKVSAIGCRDGTFWHSINF